MRLALYRRRSMRRRRMASRYRWPISLCLAALPLKKLQRAGHDVTVPFSAGRGDAAQEQTDIDSFAVLEPLADGFGNYLQSDFIVSAEELMLDKAP